MQNFEWWAYLADLKSTGEGEYYKKPLSKVCQSLVLDRLGYMATPTPHLLTFFSLLSKAENVQVNGLMLIGDFKNVGLKQVKNVERSYVSLFVQLLQVSLLLYFVTN